MRKGKEKEWKANSGRQRVHINGFIDIDTKKIATDFTDSVNSQSVIRLLEKLLKLYSSKTLHLFVDNAKYYKSGVVKEWLKKHKNGNLHFLPAYRPNLNPIERLWGFFKKKILYNKYYSEFSDFVDRCKNFFRSRKKYANDFLTTLSDNFHLFKKCDI
ncbi:MAG: IS630 family transposase [Planctomycetaceae bacterium]|nr:IS630 family transposase [Planctomycetaceae bacterium]